MTWYDVTCRDMKRDRTWKNEPTRHKKTLICDTARRDMWHDMAWRDGTWHDMTWHDMTYMTWHDMTWRNLTRHEMTWHGAPQQPRDRAAEPSEGVEVRWRGEKVEREVEVGARRQGREKADKTSTIVSKDKQQKTIAPWQPRGGPMGLTRGQCQEMTRHSSWGRPMGLIREGALIN